MKQPKKILSFLLKLFLGIGCLLVLYLKLGKEFSPEKLDLFQNALFSSKGIVCFLACIVLIPVNWGLESFKWQMICAPIEKINFKSAQASVYSGVCLGNFAPGRATEFLGKILYFSDHNKTKITVLHFINGMIQLSITLLLGLMALLFKLSNFSDDYAWISQTVIALSILLLLLFIIAILKVNSLLHFVTRLISKQKNTEHFSYSFSPALLFRLFFYSILRYLTFAFQFFLLLFIFQADLQPMHCLPGIAMYFLITSTLPMISFLEAAIRAAIALVVFKDSGISAPVLALTSVILWLMNIMVPSLIGYLVLLRMRFDFKMIKLKRE